MHGLKKVLDCNHGVETHGARRALTRGNFFHEHDFFHKKQVLVSQKLFLMIKTVNNLSILILKKIMQTINGQNHGFWGAFGSPETVVLGVPTDRFLDRNRGFYTSINRGLLGVLLAPHRPRFMGFSWYRPHKPRSVGVRLAPP